MRRWQIDLVQNSAEIVSVQQLNIFGLVDRGTVLLPYIGLETICGAIQGLTTSSKPLRYFSTLSLRDIFLLSEGTMPNI